MEGELRGSGESRISLVNILLVNKATVIKIGSTNTTPPTE